MSRYGIGCREIWFQSNQSIENHDIELLTNLRYHTVSKLIFQVSFQGHEKNEFLISCRGGKQNEVRSGLPNHSAQKRSDERSDTKN